MTRSKANIFMILKQIIMEKHFNGSFNKYKTIPSILILIATVTEYGRCSDSEIDYDYGNFPNYDHYSSHQTVQLTVVMLINHGYDDKKDYKKVFLD